MAKRAKNHSAVKALEAKKGNEAQIEYDGTALYVTAYLDLDTERQFLEVIPWSAIIRWGLYYRLSSRQIEDLITYTRLIDREILKDRKRDAERDASRTRQ
jgi:hypothetical protein